MAVLFNSLQSTVFESSNENVVAAFNESIDKAKAFLSANPKMKIHDLSFVGLQIQLSENSQAAGCAVVVHHSEPKSKGGTKASDVIVETATGISTISDITEAVQEADAVINDVLSTYIGKEFLSHAMAYVAEATSSESSKIGSDFHVLHAFLIKK
jgi:hypothetical protein